MILGNIDFILKSTNRDINYYINGGCYIFASKLKQLVGGDILYLVNEYHFVLKLDNKLYDASGNVTSKYRGSRFITEQEFMQRKRLVKEFRLC